VPLLVEESFSFASEALLRADNRLAVWWNTRTEAVSALCRRHRASEITGETFEQANRILERLATYWHEVAPSNGIRQEAEALLKRHPLRAADSLQLAAAIVWAEAGSYNRKLACLDKRLGDAAVAEGFDVELLT